MSYSNRISKLQAEGAYAVLSKAQELERKGRVIVHFEIGQPDFPTPEVIKTAAIQAIKNNKTKYSSPVGVFELRTEIAKYFSAQRNIKINEDQVVVLPGGKAGIFSVMAATINPGDEVIYPDPGFPTYRTLIDFFGGVKKPVPLLEKNDFSLDLNIFKSKLSRKTKLIILNFPGNPTGSLMPKNDLQELTKLIKSTNAYVFSDEIYSKLIYGDEQYNSIYDFPAMRDRTFILDGFSKTFCMTGWRLGYLISPKNFVPKFDYLLTHMVGCTATFTQYAGIAALQSDPTALSKMLKEFAKRRDFIVQRLNSISGVTCKTPGGAFYVFPNIKSFGLTSDKMADYILNKAGVALLSGTSFGNKGEGYLRISYATSMDKLVEGCDKIEKALAKL